MTRAMPGRRLVLLASIAIAVSAGTLTAQTLPAGPIRAVDGQVLVSGEIVGTFGDGDEIAFFNYTDYEHNALRFFRVSLAGSWQPIKQFAFVGEIRTEDLEHPRPYGAYVRIRPWPDRNLDFQIGRIPPAFGAFGRHSYSTENPLIGYPLAYQYLTSIRPDAVPATYEDLLRMRARGWQSSFPVGSPVISTGVPLVSGFQWDTGVQAHWAGGPVELTGAVTVGTLSDPRWSDNNDGRQLSGRLALRPTTGLLLGVSGSRGEWLSESVRELVDASRNYPQTGFGADVEYSRDHWVVRSELVWSRWRMPLAVTAPSGINLDALGAWVEGRYRVTPRIYGAVRVDHLGFSNVDARSRGLTRISWDAPVDRVEYGVGYYLQRNLVARAVVQHNDRDGGRVRKRTYFSGQLSYWF